MVFGDIGTSPLYTFNSIFTELDAVPEQADVQQAFSVMFWTMTWMNLGTVLTPDRILGGGNSKIFGNFHPLFFGEDEPILTKYFSKGLKPSTKSYMDSIEEYSIVSSAVLQRGQDLGICRLRYFTQSGFCGKNCPRMIFRDPKKIFASLAFLGCNEWAPEDLLQIYWPSDAC